MKVIGVTAAASYRTDIDGDGHGLVADEPVALGGANAGPAPFVLVLAGLAACTGATLRMYARRKGWPDIEMRIELGLEPGEARHVIRRRVDVRGAPDDAAIARLRDIVERTPVTLALKSGFDIATVLEPTASAAEPA
jgi:putative redox protein